MPQNYNLLNQPITGGYFQKNGALVTLNYLAEMIVYLLVSCTLILRRGSNQKIVTNAMKELAESTGDQDLISIKDHWDGIRKRPEVKRQIVEFRLKQKELRNEFARHRLVPDIEDLT